MKRSMWTSLLVVLVLSVGNGVSAARAAAPAAASGGTIAFSYGDHFPGGDLLAPSEVFTVRPDGSHLKQLTHSAAGTNAALPSISSDGTRIVYEVGNASTSSYGLWTMDVDGRHKQQVTNEPGFLHLTPSWSPDGNEIAFTRCDLPYGFPSSCDIALVDADGSNLRTIVAGHVGHTRPEFSPDGTRIVFESDRAGLISAVWVVNTDGSHLRRVTSPKTHAFWPDWSADGSRILYTDNCCRPHSNVWSVNPDGSDALRLTDSAPQKDSSFGSFGPSGGDIVFFNNDAYDDPCCGDLLIRRGDGTVSTVIEGAANLVLASWGPTPAARGHAPTSVPATAAPATTHRVAHATAPVRADATPLAGRIVFFDYNVGQIFAVNPDGSGLTQVTHDDANHASFDPHPTPDGRIVFSRVTTNSPDDHARIWIMDADGGNAQQLASETPGYRDYTPNVTPDGKNIVFVRCQPGDGVCAIWTMRFDGTHKRALTPYQTQPDEVIDYSPTVSTDGSKIAFARNGARHHDSDLRDGHRRVEPAPSRLRSSRRHNPTSRPMAT